MLTQMEIAMLKGRGFDLPAFERVDERTVIARASKSTGNGIARAEALGRNESDAARKLVAVVTRP